MRLPSPWHRFVLWVTCFTVVIVLLAVLVVRNVRTEVLATTCEATPIPNNSVPACDTARGALFRDTNVFRQAHRRVPLKWGGPIGKVAQKYALHMSITGILIHNPNLGTQVRTWQWVGENVGYGPDWQTVQQAFKESDHHRANMLDRDYDWIGVGAKRAGDTIWIVVVFRQAL